MSISTFRNLFAGLCFALFVPLSAFADVVINEKNFPDENFRKYLLEQDYGKDGVITDEEIAGITSIYVGSKQISTLEGIRFFTALTVLDCYNNKLTTLDLSNFASLETLSCGSDQLTTLDVSGCTALRYLFCEDGPSTELNVSGCTALEVLFCEITPLTNLDVSGCTALTDLLFDERKVETLDISGTAIKSINIYTPPTIDPSMVHTPRPIRTIKAVGCTALERLTCKNTHLTSLDVSGCTALTDLSCENNQLTSLDVSGCTALTDLRCENNQLTSLDLSNYAALGFLYCYNNQLESLYLSGCTALHTLWCYNNQLTNLDVSDCVTLDYFLCYYNQLYGEYMDKFIESLPNGHDLIYLCDNYSETEGNICTWNQVEKIKEKGWEPREMTATYGRWRECEGLKDWFVEGQEGQDEYWAALCTPFGYTLPANAEAYIGTLNEDGTAFNMTYIGREVPRGVPVVIRGNSANIFADIDDDITAEIGDNDLTGQYASYDEPTGELYALSVLNGVVGFYKCDDVVDKYTAVLRLPEGVASNGYKLVFDEDDIMAIEDATFSGDGSSATYYDLQGRRVAEPQKGQLYIVNGKKVVVK